MTSPSPSRLRRLAAITLLLAAGLLPAFAADAPKGDAWQFEATPYVWAAGMQGHVAIDGKPAAGLAVDQSFSDILKVLDMGAMATFEARKDQWGLLVDAVYFKVSDEGNVAGKHGFAALAAQAAVTQEMYTLAGFYRPLAGATTVDAIGGLRYSSIKWDVQAQASVPIWPDPSRRLTETKDWTDPFLGVRVQHRLNERWALLGYADIGGFGVGSQLSWQAMVGGSYAFSPGVVAKAGYRYISIDYDKDGFKYDMANAGVFLGVGFRW